MTSLARWNVAVGNFFFRYRNALFPIVIGILLIATRPGRLFENDAVQCSWLLLGAAVALAGEAIRLLTIGYDYIDRGGKGGSVYASRLVQGGVYSHVRNPMYLGNILIAIGLIMFSGSPLALMTAVPFFLVVYETIVAAEEAYLRSRFGKDYEIYCDAVPRFWPLWKGLAANLGGMSYDWKRALRKDYGNLYLIAMSLIVLSGWRMYFLESAQRVWDMRTLYGAAILTASVLYFSVMRLKKLRAFG